MQNNMTSSTIKWYSLKKNKKTGTYRKDKGWGTVWEFLKHMNLEADVKDEGEKSEIKFDVKRIEGKLMVSKFSTRPAVVSNFLSRLH